MFQLILLLCNFRPFLQAKIVFYVNVVSDLSLRDLPTNSAFISIIKFLTTKQWRILNWLGPSFHFKLATLIIVGKLVFKKWKKQWGARNRHQSFLIWSNLQAMKITKYKYAGKRIFFDFRHHKPLDSFRFPERARCSFCSSAYVLSYIFFFLFCSVK